MRLQIPMNSGNSLVEFTSLQMAGRKGFGAYTLAIVLRGYSSAIGKMISITNINISILDQNNSGSLLLGCLSSNQVAYFGQYAREEQLTFEFQLSASHLEALEEYRHDCDLNLSLWLRATVVDGTSISGACHNSSVSITRERWLDALFSMGYKKTLLFEVPVPIQEGLISNLIDKAQYQIAIGHYKDAVMQCRRIIEAVENIRSDNTESKMANKKLVAGDREAMTVRERMLSMREQVKNVCQLSAHGDEEFTRSQAKSILGLTLTLLAEPTVGFVLPDSMSQNN